MYWQAGHIFDKNKECRFFIRKNMNKIIKDETGNNRK